MALHTSLNIFSIARSRKAQVYSLRLLLLLKLINNKVNLSVTSGSHPDRRIGDGSVFILGKYNNPNSSSRRVSNRRPLRRQPRESTIRPSPTQRYALTVIMNIAK